MAGKVANIKVYSPLKLHSGLIGQCHAICHYSYNLPLAATLKDDTTDYKRTVKRQTKCQPFAK